MTILFVTHYAGFYGANKSLLTLVCLLRERYSVNPIVLLPTNGQMCDRLRETGISYKVHHYYWWVNNNHGIFQWLLNKRKQWLNYVHATKLSQLFLKEEPKLVYTNSVCVNIGVLIAKELHIPHIWHYREAFAPLGFRLSLSDAVSHAIFASDVTKSHILVSDYLMSFYSPYLPSERMVMIYNGVDLPNGRNERKINKREGRLKVACAGLMSEQKNQLELLQAQALLYERGVEIETYFYGSYKEEYLLQMQQYIEAHNLKKIAHIIGHIDDVFSALETMNIGVVSARDEAFGRVTIEYMLMHMPVVVSNSGANPELIESGKTGYIYQLGNVEQLADQIEQYIHQPELLQTQGNKAAHKAKSEFSAWRNAEHIYEQIVRAVNAN